MALIGKYNQVKTPEDIREEEYLESIYQSGKQKGIIIATLVCNITFLATTLIINLIVK